MIRLFHDLSNQCSKLTTEQYSTSFSSAINLLHKDLRKPVHNIYGFVRFADEIVDSFHDHDKKTLLDEFKTETFKAIQRGISLNPILHSFQQTINSYKIPDALINSFFKSMEADLDKKIYSEVEYREYIYGSAEVVGLMCLYVFCEGNEAEYEKLKPYARALGAAFQKVNFLRDIRNDKEVLDRTYFPGIDFKNFTSQHKAKIEEEISRDFEEACTGIKMLPEKARFGVYVAYRYYMSLLNKIKKTQPSLIFESRIRVPNYSKASILFVAGIRSQLNIL